MRTLSLTAVVCMGLLAGATCSVRFVILTPSRQAEFTGPSWLPLFMSFKWPSVVYAPDVFGRDIFFALSMLRTRPVAAATGGAAGRRR